MEKLSRKEVEHIANLANINLTSDEIELFQDQLSSVIEYNMNLLSEVDITDVDPTAQTTGLQNVWREDNVKPSLDSAMSLSQSPDQKDGQFRVKRILGES